MPHDSVHVPCHPLAFLLLATKLHVNDSCYVLQFFCEHDPEKGGARRPETFDHTLLGDDACDLAAKCLEWVVFHNAKYFRNRAEVRITFKIEQWHNKTHYFLL